jgi:hypothetical protein
MLYAHDREINIYRIASVLLLFLISSLLLYPRTGQQQDTILKISRGSLIRIRDNKSFVRSDTIITIPPSLVIVPETKDQNTVLFYDSLKAKASRAKLTRALFDLVIISPDTSSSNKIIEKSDEDFREYSGIKIRNIQVRRLNVFGADINNPGSYEPNKVEKLDSCQHQ